MVNSVDSHQKPQHAASNRDLLWLQNMQPLSYINILKQLDLISPPQIANGLIQNENGKVYSVYSGQNDDLTEWTHIYETDLNIHVWKGTIIEPQAH